MVIVGVDVSKATLDIFVKPSGLSLRIANNLKGYKQWWKSCRFKDPNQVMIVLEHTGKYSRQWELFLRSKGLSYCKISALQIKRSLGVIRGKDDKIDAIRIAEYGWLRREGLQAEEPLTDELMALKELLSLRAQLVRDRAGYLNSLKEHLACGGKKSSPGSLVPQRIIRCLSEEIKGLEIRIKALIKKDQELKKLCELLTSIKGVGLIVACTMLCCTGGFKRFNSARKFNCYAGLAPFKQESGTSIKGRSRVSNLANHEIKVLLNMAAFTAIQYDPQLKAYYQRRVANGKSKMNSLNVVKAKIVARIFAVVKRQTPYQPLLTAA